MRHIRPTSGKQAVALGSGGCARARTRDSHSQTTVGARLAMPITSDTGLALRHDPWLDTGNVHGGTAQLDFHLKF